MKIQRSRTCTVRKPRSRRRGAPTGLQAAQRQRIASPTEVRSNSPTTWVLKKIRHPQICWFFFTKHLIKKTSDLFCWFFLIQRCFVRMDRLQLYNCGGLFVPSLKYGRETSLSIWTVPTFFNAGPVVWWLILKPNGVNGRLATRRRQGWLVVKW